MLRARLEPEPTRLAEPILAWRTWTLAGSRRGRPLLLPIAGPGSPWHPREPARASCRQRRAHEGRVPGVGCRCGLHATREVEPLRRAREPAVLGRVALWGRVIEHERGYRAEYGYPQRLRLVCPLCLWRWGVATPNACEVVVRGRDGRMTPLCGPHLELGERSGLRARRLLPAPAVEAALLSGYAVDTLR